MSGRIAAVLLAAFALVALGSAQQPEDEGKDTKYTYKAMCIVDGKYTVASIGCRQEIAIGKWQNSVNASGWTFFEAETFDIVSPEIQAYAAGYLEGLLSRTVLKYHLINNEDYCTNFTGYCNRLNNFLGENQKWIASKLAQVPKDDIYWGAVNRTYYQVSGMVDGYEDRPINPRITYELHPIVYLNMNGDFYDLEKKLNKTRDPTEPDGHCSGFVKVAPNNSDLFISQVTMSGFQQMLRVLKLYKFAYNREIYPGYGTTFASYPGLLYSSDDFALMTSGLAVIETTISVFDNKLFEKTQSTGQLLTWVRAVVANQLGRTAREWCKIYARYNSGTYNNQWVVVDYNAFKPNQPLPEYGLIYVLEQMPGYVQYQDLTWFLRKYSYFPSYNIPYFKNITEISGFIQQGTKLGDWYRWGKSPRARIFDRDHDNVKDIDTLTKLMRYNNYKQDPFSRCKCDPPYTAEAGISARGDLNPANGTYEFGGMGHVNHGGLDYKGTNVALARQLRFRSWGGPTWDQVPAFKWSNTDFKVKHVGHPDEWKFDWVEHKWETTVSM